MGVKGEEEKPGEPVERHVDAPNAPVNTRLMHYAFQFSVISSPEN
jgi:hypothetical protein